MRIAVLTAVVFLAFGAESARAQVNNLWGGTPRQIVNTPIDTSKAMMGAHADKAFKMPSSSTNSPFNLGNVFPKISMPSWPPKTPQVSVMPQAQNQFQPTTPKGAVNMFDFMKTKK